ncbi:Na+/H+ antiporter subunit E [Streptomyces sp. SLBN-31]|uniref:Na+/H+ antiporter subunit E n=1 Tax=Streptomyces sp. SLBN-31 TaxID=2768444 RepID=UPI00114DED00|nr:Na+/H+ antiporter subunit E [Streptomyces sp. SLBN-31]TQJ91260.1 Na+/H+ ion antiporter subunit [Streptomyces sp. SLBN-31]
MTSAAAFRRPVVRTAIGVLSWWCALYSLWFLFSGQGGWLVAAWGAAAAAVATVAARVVVVQGLLQGRPKGRWAASVPRAAWQTLVDFGVVLRVLARCIAGGRRGPVGRFVRRDTGLPEADSGVAAAWLTMTATYSPNAYVLDVDRSTGQALLHDLRPMTASEEPA